MSGTALIILLLQLIDRVTRYPIPRSLIDTLAIIMTVALQISLLFVGGELFTDFYNETAHAASVRYLYFGLDGLASLAPGLHPVPQSGGGIVLILISIGNRLPGRPRHWLSCLMTAATASAGGE